MSEAEGDKICFERFGMSIKDMKAAHQQYIAHQKLLEENEIGVEVRKSSVIIPAPYANEVR